MKAKPLARTIYIQTKISKQTDPCGQYKTNDRQKRVKAKPLCKNYLHPNQNIKIDGPLWTVQSQRSSKTCEKETPLKELFTPTPIYQNRLTLVNSTNQRSSKTCESETTLQELFTSNPKYQNRLTLVDSTKLAIVKNV